MFIVIKDQNSFSCWFSKKKHKNHQNFTFKHRIINWTNLLCKSVSILNFKFDRFILECNMLYVITWKSFAVFAFNFILNSMKYFFLQVKSINILVYTILTNFVKHFTKCSYLYLKYGALLFLPYIQI